MNAEELENDIPFRFSYPEENLSQTPRAMARPLRIEYPGAFYHLMNRGNTGQDLFRTKRDREKFLECLETAVERFSLKIHAYCRMPTHYDLLVETMDANLSRGGSME